jgi:hypothetical protein
LAPLSHAAIARLNVIPRMDQNPYIICGRLTGQPLKGLQPAWARIRTAAALEDVRLHDLRRTVGSWLVREGSSLHLVGAVLNHKDSKTTAGYAYFQIEDRQAALDRHGEKVLNLAADRLSNKPAKRDESSILPQRSPPKSQSFTRQQLYELVWSQPVTKLAKTLGISDVGLAKVCRRANIPVPQRGYWAKITAALPAARPELPQYDQKFRDRVDIKSRALRRQCISLRASEPLLDSDKRSDTGNAPRTPAVD